MEKTNYKYFMMRKKLSKEEIFISMNMKLEFSGYKGQNTTE